MAILGLATRFGGSPCRRSSASFDNDWIIGAALALYVVEFVADKMPWVDTLWDTVHTVVRPLGGALVAVATLGDASPWLQGLTALRRRHLAAGSHFTKASTRAAANASPEPFSNWVLSLAEDVFVIGLGVLALKYPVAALVVTALILRGHRRWRCGGSSGSCGGLGRRPAVTA